MLPSDPAHDSALPEPYFNRAAHTVSVSTISDDGAFSPRPRSHPAPPSLPGRTPSVASAGPNDSHSTSIKRYTSLVRTRHVRLHLSARDVPEPDARSHTSYAVLYYARDLPSPPAPANRATDPAPDSGPIHDSDDDHDHVHDDLRHTSAVTAAHVLDGIANGHANGTEDANTKVTLPDDTQTHANGHSPTYDNDVARHRSAPHSRHPSRAQKSPRGDTPQTHSQNHNIHRNHTRSRNRSNHNRKTQSAAPPDDQAALRQRQERQRARDRPVSPVSGANPTGPTTAGHNDNLRSLRHAATTPHPRPPSRSHSRLRRRSVRESAASTATSSSHAQANILTPLFRLVPQSPSRARAPQHALSRVAPPTPASSLKSPSLGRGKSGWIRIGTTELARKHGRDVEFARTFTLSFRAADGVVIRACVFDGDGKRRLVGVADFAVSAAYAADGARVCTPLRFTPIAGKADHRKTRKTPNGTLVIVAQRLPSTRENGRGGGGGGGEVVETGRRSTAKEQKFRLDVECGRIMRATALSMAVVKRVFYTVHAALDRRDETSDAWTMLFRSDPVEMIASKKDGGSMQYNYFSSVKLRAMPGSAGNDKQRGHQHQQRHSQNHSENGAEARDGEGGAPEEYVIRGHDTVAMSLDDTGNVTKDRKGVLGLMSKMVGWGAKPRQLFSLPGADLLLLRDDTRLKLSVWEDGGRSAGFDLVADTLFSMRELRQRGLGESSAIKVHANVVGKAVLKYVECAPDPHYFCLSLRMQSIN